MTRLLRVREVADLCGLSRDSVYRAIGSGELPAFELRRNALRVREDDLDAFIDARKRQPREGKRPDRAGGRATPAGSFTAKLADRKAS